MIGRLLAGLVLLIAAIVAAYAGGGWYFANKIHSGALDGAERRASLALDSNVRIASAATERSRSPRSATTRRRSWRLRASGGSGGRAATAN